MKFEIAPKSTEVELNWDDSRLYCFTLIIDGKTGWRLPNIAELYEIYQSENDFEKQWYWSTNEDVSDYPLVKLFSDGNNYNIEKNGKVYVRAIRDLTAN